MPGDITGSMVIEGGGHELDLPRRAGLHQRAARRRDQPHPAEDPGGAAGGDGGAPGHHRRRRRARCRRPFVVAATQNPVEYEGTYPLPEAQLDRFLLKLTLPLPPRDDELAIVHRHADGFDPRDIAAAGVQRWPAPPDIAAGAGGRRAGAGAAARSPLHRRHRPGHARAPSLRSGQPARRDRAAGRARRPGPGFPAATS